MPTNSKCPMRVPLGIAWLSIMTSGIIRWKILQSIVATWLNLNSFVVISHALCTGNLKKYLAWIQHQSSIWAWSSLARELEMDYQRLACFWNTKSRRNYSTTHPITINWSFWTILCSTKTRVLWLSSNVCSRSARSRTARWTRAGCNQFFICSRHYRKIRNFNTAGGYKAWRWPQRIRSSIIFRHRI